MPPQIKADTDHQGLLADLREAAAALNDATTTIAQVEDQIARNRRSLKTRKKFLWLDPDGRGPNTVIDGKNEAIRGAQHAALTEVDHEAKRLRSALDVSESRLRKLRAEQSEFRRAYAIALESLATYRAGLNARAAQAIGTAATNGSDTPTPERIIPNSAIGMTMR